MINITPKGGKFLVSFSGKRHQFNDYINKIMSFDNKEYDYETKSWAFSADTIQLVEQAFSYKRSAPHKKEEVIRTLKRPVASSFSHIGKSMKLQPYEYQKETIHFGVNAKEALLVLPCGSGKTPIGIGLYLEAKENKLIKGPGMVVVKASLKTQWQKEIGKFSDLSSRVIRSKKDIASSYLSKVRRRETRMRKMVREDKSKKDIKLISEEIKSLKQDAESVFKAQFDNIDLFVLNYETLNNKDVRIEIRKRRVDFIMADEVHYIKNRKADRSKALYEFKDVPYKIGATATPIGKNPEDLFGIFSFVGPGLFPTWKSFERSYIRYRGYNKSFKNLPDLRKKISKAVFVKGKEEISDQLPSLVVIQRHCDLYPKQQAMNKTIMEELDALREKENKLKSSIKTEKEQQSSEELAKVEALILAHQTAAQQLANTEELLQMSDSEIFKKFLTGASSAKMELLTELVEEILDSGEKVAIFSRYKRMQDIFTRSFSKSFPKAKIAYVNGSLSDKERHHEVYDKFRDQEDYKILLLSDAGAEGLNLSACKYLIEFDLAASFAIATQRWGRVERADSRHDNVFVYQLIANGSWDEIQQKIIDKKEGYDAEIIR